eukprot:6186831-Pleurochrysis_carterae.AAC.4
MSCPVQVAHDKSAHCGSSIEQPVAEAAPNSAMANVDAAAENNMPIINERDAHNRMDEEIAMDSHEVGPRAAPAARSKRIRRRDILTWAPHSRCFRQPHQLPVSYEPACAA